jgi:hypothetical protein
MESSCLAVCIINLKIILPCVRYLRRTYRMDHMQHEESYQEPQSTADAASSVRPGMSWTLAASGRAPLGEACLTDSMCGMSVNISVFCQFWR